MTDNTPTSAAAAPEVLWSPPADVIDTSRIGAYLRWLREHRGLDLDGYPALWAWSVDDLDGFWGSIWEHFGVAGGEVPPVVLADASMPGARWFPGVELNYAQEALRLRGEGDGDRPAVIARAQGEPDRALSLDDLRRQVARCRTGLARLGVGRGDRVAGYLGNRVEALVGFLATASLGAVWTSCPPEFGVAGALGRFAQVEPTVLLAVSGYHYGAKDVDRRDDLEAIVDGLPGLGAVVGIPVPGIAEHEPAGHGHTGHGHTGHGPDGRPTRTTWAELLADEGELAFELVPFDHPLYVLFSSGTTGLPKPIVHGHGGIVVEHLKALALHLDLGPADRFFWFTTTGWMMWNFLVSGLLVGSTVVLFDGDPGHPDLGELWRLAEDVGITYFGTSAPFLMACRDRDLHPGRDHDLAPLRGVGSTGAPLPPEGFRWVYDRVGPDVLLGSISGGTDVCTAFVGSVPLLPVLAGRIPCRCLGARVEAFDEAGVAVVGRPGELVLAAPLPSMPVGFWNDAGGHRYRAAYFEDRPGVWTHGDWITIEADGSCTITGRSDATLNRGGVRLGTAELYSVVEDFDEVADSLVVHLEEDGGPGELLLFVVLASGELTPELRQDLVRALRTQLSPRHAPDAVIAVPGIPRTRSGKKLEVPVKAILAGKPASSAVGLDAITDPGLLAPFEALARDRHVERD